MANIILQNTKFDFDLGCRILKLRGGNSPFEELDDIWDDIIPIEFSEIAQLPRIAQRRVAINFMGIDKIFKHTNPTLVDRSVINKTTMWVTEDGTLKTVEFDDVYELYEVDREVLLNEKVDRRFLPNFYFVKANDTSTGKEHPLWVDINSVANTNDVSALKDVNAIHCIAWTFMTNVPKGNIEKIVRQGDCINFKQIDPNVPKIPERHLTEKEYLKYLELES